MSESVRSIIRNVSVKACLGLSELRTASKHYFQPVGFGPVLRKRTGSSHKI